MDVVVSIIKGIGERLKINQDMFFIDVHIEKLLAQKYVIIKR